MSRLDELETKLGATINKVEFLQVIEAVGNDDGRLAGVIYRLCFASKADLPSLQDDLIKAFYAYFEMTDIDESDANDWYYANKGFSDYAKKMHDAGHKESDFV